ncbi:hypothetical protein Tco_1494311 [Tanacetum coccineum]
MNRPVKLVPKSLFPPADKTTTSRQELELLFSSHNNAEVIVLRSNINRRDLPKDTPYFEIAVLRSYALSWKPCQGDSLNLPDHRRFERCKSSCKRFSLRFRIEVYGGKEEDVGFGELGEGGIGVVSKIGEIGGDVGEELFGDRGGEDIFEVNNKGKENVE